MIAIDPKGDLGNLLLLFDDLAPASFEPWVDVESARRDGLTPKAAAENAAATWKKGLAEWGLSGDDIKALRAGHEATIYTPGSGAGVGLNVLQSLDAPGFPFETAEEDLRDEIASVVGGMLGLLKIDADPLQSREHIFLSNLVEEAWRAGRALTLEELMPAVADPPFDKVGALPLESVYPRRDREALMRALNNLLASPRFESWREGEPLDIGQPAAHEGRQAAALHRLHRPSRRRRAALRHRAAARQDQDLDAPAARHHRAARARLHGRDLRLLPAAPEEPADQAAAADAAEAGARAGRRRGARDPEPGRPRLQGARQHGHLARGEAADGPGPRAPARRARRLRPRPRRRWSRCSTRRASASSCCTTSTARVPCCCTRASRCRTCAGRSRARRSGGS